MLASFFRYVFTLIIFLILPGFAIPAETEIPPDEADTEVIQNGAERMLHQYPAPPVLAMAVMAEGIRDYAPHNVAVVFSIHAGSVSCYSLFDPVPERTFIIHRWYHRDRLSTQKRLALQPPRWATYSAIQLREVDKGPWRVEIIDLEGNLMDELRFSVTD